MPLFHRLRQCPDCGRRSMRRVVVTIDEEGKRRKVERWSCLHCGHVVGDKR